MSRPMTKGTRKLIAALVLVVGLPVYIVVAVTLVGLFDRPPLILEFAIYLGLGLLWAFPLKKLFLGIAAKEPGER